MKKFSSLLLIFCILSLAIINPANAQTVEELKLGLSRDFGYGGFGNDIQGLFTMKINNPPANITRVVFFIDTTSMGEDTSTPFSLQFNTDSYPLGVHILSAIGYTPDGKEINSNKIQAQFVPANAATQGLVKIVLPILGLVVLIAIISVFLPLILSRGKMSSLPLGAQRKYGIGGGAVCPKCGRPFPLRLWFINLGFNKLDRCPYCGKWSFVRPRSLPELRAAEAAELSNVQAGNQVTGETDAEKLKKELDDSRYHDT